MNRLALCQRLRQEVGFSGSGPTTTIGQAGEMKQVVDWIDTVWTRIQQSHNWDWLWTNPTITITAATNVTTASVPASRYEKERAFDTLGAPMVYRPWSEFAVVWPTALIASGNPREWTIRPDKAVVVNAKPASNFSFTVERYSNPTAMAADADVPTGLPDEHHMAIVWRAVMLYGGFDQSSETYQHAKMEYDRSMRALGMTERPTMEWGC